MLLVGLTMLGRSVSEGSDKKVPHPSRSRVGCGVSNPTAKNCTATETPRRIPRDTTAWEVEGPLTRKSVTPGSES